MIYDESHIPQRRGVLLDSLTLTETLGGHAHERKRSWSRDTKPIISTDPTSHSFPFEAKKTYRLSVQPDKIVHETIHEIFEKLNLRKILHSRVLQLSMIEKDAFLALCIEALLTLL